jgi:RNA polymerase sigma factor for flagellar operon FliA
VDENALYLIHQETVDATIARVCRRQRLRPEDAEDFISQFRLKLLEDDCAVLRKFEGRASLSTYLTVVAQRAYKDWQNSRWGKWRPSVEARRLGATALLLERLMTRDGYTLDQALEQIRTTHDETVTRTVLEQLAARLPARSPRRSYLPADVLHDRPATHSDPVAALDGAQAAAEAGRAARLLSSVLSALPREQRMLLKMRYHGGLSVAQMARMFQTDAKPLYRQLDHLRHTLAGQLEAHGFTRDQLDDLLAHDGFKQMPLDVHAFADEPAGRSAVEEPGIAAAERIRKRHG